MKPICKWGGKHDGDLLTCEWGGEVTAMCERHFEVIKKGDL